MRLYHGPAICQPVCVLYQLQTYADLQAQAWSVLHGILHLEAACAKLAACLAFAVDFCLGYVQALDNLMAGRTTIVVVRDIIQQLCFSFHQPGKMRQPDMALWGLLCVQTDLCPALQAHRLSTIQNADMIAGEVLSGSPDQCRHPLLPAQLAAPFSMAPIPAVLCIQLSTLCSCSGRGYR